MGRWAVSCRRLWLPALACAALAGGSCGIGGPVLVSPRGRVPAWTCAGLDMEAGLEPAPAR